jgi:hypothetical protein
VQRRRDPVPPGQRVVREYVLIPSATRPRLIPPASERRAAAAVVRRRYGTGGRFGRLAVGVAAGVVRTGVTDRLIRDRLRMTVAVDKHEDDIETVLGDVLDTKIVVGLHVGTARVNRKPVLHAVDNAGHTVAFVKVGHTDPARDLVRREAATLRSLADHSFISMEIPTVIALRQWHDLELLVLSPVFGRPVRSSVRTVPFAAMSELAGFAGTESAELSSSPFLERLERLAHALSPAETTERYAAALAGLGNTDVTLHFGSWHGDWQPFNMARLSRGRVGVWDWERFTDESPVGFDALHYVLQVVLHRHGIAAQATRSFLELADAIATRAGVPAPQAPVVVAAYAAEITGRYLSLLEGADGQLLARRAHWGLGLIESAMARV